MGLKLLKQGRGLEQENAGVPEEAVTIEVGLCHLPRRLLDEAFDRERGLAFAPLLSVSI